MYAFGALIAERTPVKAAGFSEDDLAEVVKGMKDAALGKELAVKLEEYGPKVEQLLNEKQTAKAEDEQEGGRRVRRQGRRRKRAPRRAASGLIYIETLTAGTGKQPAATDTVSVHYKGTLIDGTEFDSSYKRGQPTEFPLNGVIKCWTEGVAKMKVGGKAKLVCPSDIAYGDRGAGANIPGGSTLMFEVELLAIKDAAAPPPGHAHHARRRAPRSGPQGRDGARSGAQGWWRGACPGSQGWRSGACPGPRGRRGPCSGAQVS